jgi:hypothetical protein
VILYSLTKYNYNDQVKEIARCRSCSMNAELGRLLCICVDNKPY